MALILELDPTAEGTGTPLVLVDAAAGWSLAEFDPGVAELDILYASSVDTDGENPASRRYRNTTVTAKLEILKSSAALVQAELNKLGEKVGKIGQEGGTLKVTLPSGSTVVADLVAADYRLEFNHLFVSSNLAQVTLTLPRRPFWRGAEVDLGDKVELSLPALIFSDSVPGDVDAIGRLVVDNDVAADQWWLTWGVENDAQYTHTTSSGSGALFYEGESRTVLGGSSVVTGPAGASGGGTNNVVRNTNLPGSESEYLAVLSTQASGGGAHLSHVGNFTVYARVQVPITNIGTVSVALEWSVGDFLRVNRNTARSLDFTAEGQWRLLNLGQVTIQKVATGTQRWEGRVIAKSTRAGDDLDVDYIALVPSGVSGEASGVVNAQTAPSSFSARDEYEQTAGALTGKTLPIGGTWNGTGDLDDFQVNATADTAERTAVSDAGSLTSGRFVTASTPTTLTDTIASIDHSYTAAPGGVIAHFAMLITRWTNISNWMIAAIGPSSLGPAVQVFQNVAGTQTTLGIFPTSFATNTLYRVRLYVDAAGRWHVFFGRAGQGLREMGSGHRTELATGGGIASGTIGFADWNQDATANTRTYDNFWAAAPVKDAAIFASQSLELRHNLIQREDTAGVAWAGISDYRGSYLTVPPAGQEGRTARVIVKACRNDPETMPDTTIDDISARLFVTPRFLSIPD